MSRRPAGSVRAVFEVWRLDGQGRAQSTAAATPRAPDEVFERQRRPEHRMPAAAVQPEPVPAHMLTEVIVA